MIARRVDPSRFARDDDGRPIVCVVCARPFRINSVPLDELCSTCALDLAIGPIPGRGSREPGGRS